MELVYVGHIPERIGFQMARHRHEHHELIIVLSGGMSVTIEPDATCEAPGGTVLWYPAGVWHAETSFADVPLMSIFLAFHGEMTAPVRVVHDRDARCRRLARWLSDDFSAGLATVPAIADLLLAEFQRLAVDVRVDDALVAETRRYVQAHIDRPISVDDLAYHAGVSKFHFIRRYQACAGVTPMSDVRRLRVEHALHLILTTRIELKRIAAMVGLANAQHLSRLFRRQLGTTPGSYRSYGRTRSG